MLESLSRVRRFDEAEVWYARARAIALISDTEISGSLIAAERGDTAEANRRLRRAIASDGPQILLRAIRIVGLLADIQAWDVVPGVVRSGNPAEHSLFLFMRLKQFQHAGAPDSVAAAAAELLRDADEHLRRSPDDPLHLMNVAWAHAALGRKEAAIRAIDQAITAMPVTLDAFDGPDYLLVRAEILVLVGEPAAAVEQLRVLLAIASPVSVPWLRVSPRVASLRGRSDFEALLR